MNIEVNFALPRWYIILLPKPLHSSITHGAASSYPRPLTWRSSSIIGAPESPLALLSLNWHFNVWFSPPYYLFCPHSSSRMGAPQSPPRLRLGAPLFHSRLFVSLPFRRCSAWMGCSAGYALLNLHRSSLAWICAPQFHSALLHHHQHSPCPPLTPNRALLLSWWRTTFPREFIILPFKLHFDSPRYNVNSNLSDITNRAKWHWISISPPRQPRIIQKYKECL